MVRYNNYYINFVLQKSKQSISEHLTIITNINPAFDTTTDIF